MCIRDSIRHLRKECAASGTKIRIGCFKENLGAKRLYQMCIRDSAGPQEAGVPVRDQPISFSPVHRRYGFRPVREYRADCPGDAQPETEHDPFSEWR